MQGIWKIPIHSKKMLIWNMGKSGICFSKEIQFDTPRDRYVVTATSIMKRGKDTAFGNNHQTYGMVLFKLPNYPFVVKAARTWYIDVTQWMYHLPKHLIWKNYSDIRRFIQTQRSHFSGEKLYEGVLNRDVRKGHRRDRLRVVPVKFE